MKYLFLAQADDIGALQVAAGLRRRHGSAAVAVVSPEALAMAPEWRHALTPQENSPRLRIESHVRLASGVELGGDELKTIFNRLQIANAPHFHAAVNTDKEYASAELSALWVSWLSGLAAGGVALFNPPQRGALQPGYSRLEWLKLASRAGLSVGPVAVSPLAVNLTERDEDRQNTRLYLLAAGNFQVVLNAPESHSLAGVEEAVRRLQALSSCPLLELRFQASHEGEPNSLLLESVNPFPALIHETARLAVIQMLEEAAE